MSSADKKSLKSVQTFGRKVSKIFGNNLSNIVKVVGFRKLPLLLPLFVKERAVSRSMVLLWISSNLKSSESRLLSLFSCLVAID